MKKLLLLACAAFAFAACNDNDDETRFATENTKIVDGSMTGSNMHFLGTSTVVAADGGVYMHRTRFAATMPPQEMRLHKVSYTPGTGAALSFEAESLVPEMLLPNEAGGGHAWKPMAAYTLTQVEGSIDGVTCRVSFSCNVPRLGIYQVTYEGLLKE